MVSKDVGRLYVLSAFVALCAVVLFSSGVDARGYGDEIRTKTKQEKFGRGRGLGKHLRGGKIGRDYGLRRGHGKRNRGYGRNLRKSLKKYKSGNRGRGNGRRFGDKRRGEKYRGRKNKGLNGKKYRDKARKGYPKKKDENC